MSRFPAAAQAPDDQSKLKKQLNELMKREENKFCADCGSRGPRWASINLGVFVCIACSGIHRSLGVHVTFVRSVNLDSWTAEQVQQMQRWGNARAKAHFEAALPSDYFVPSEHSGVRDKELWIRDKYERKRFVEEPQRTEGRRSRRSIKEEEEEEEEEEGEEEEEERRPVRRRDSRTGSRYNEAERRPLQLSTTVDMLSFDEMVPVAAVAVSFGDEKAGDSAGGRTQRNGDEWASMGASCPVQSDVKDAFASPTPAAVAPVDQHVNKMANIMASFGTGTGAQQQTQAQHGGNTFQQGMGTPSASVMGTPMNGMGMMQLRPVGMSLPMTNMAMNGQGFMPSNMMGYPMQNQMLGFPQQAGMMMGGAASMGFQGQQMGMNPMGMHMNQRGFQHLQQQQQQQQMQQQQQQFQHQQQQYLQQQRQQQQQQQPHLQQHQQQQQQPQHQTRQQPQVGGLSQPFVNFG